MEEKNTQTLREVTVWDRSTRWFHWINVLSIIGLMFVGIALLNGKSLGVSPEGKVLLKTVHVYIGYVFALNLAWRIVWGFLGNHYARWTTTFAFGRRYVLRVRDYLAGVRGGRPPAYAGHNPLGQLMVAALFILLSVQLISGLVLAGTDVYMPPFGGYFAEWVTGGGAERMAALTPLNKEAVVAGAYTEMREFRSPFIETHEAAFYLLLAAILLHVAAVVVTELRERSGLISAMINGRKVLAERPVDERA